MSQSIEQLLAGLHPLEREVLDVFRGSVSLEEQLSVPDKGIAAQTGLDESRLSMALGWLLAKEILVVEHEQTARFVSLTDLGRAYATHNYPEGRILQELRGGRPLLIQEVRTRLGLEQLEVSTAIGNLKQHGVIRIGHGGAIEAIGESWPYESIYKGLLQELSGATQPVAYAMLEPERQLFLEQHLEKDWKTRGVIKWSEKTTKVFTLAPLGRVLLERLPAETFAGEVSQLTPEMLKDGSWRGKRFRKFHIDLKPPRIAAGRVHPYRQFLDDVQAKLVSMGFQEMRGPLVESEFWNMDALFMPQFHPARDIHDVYFAKGLSPADDIDPALLERVAATHERGGTSGSTGWRYTFDRSRARQPILRSQGTAVSARTLANRPSVPGKYFSVTRCFRYDQVDATHAPDFFQIEGIVLDSTITFRTLLGLLKLFAVELARADRIKFLPAYFPFTEPSVELHVRHPKLGWMELGGAGLFRPEVTTPMGVTVPVIAWGLGLDRMAMVAMGLHDIRDLFSTDLDFLRTLRPPGSSAETGRGA
ncbi:MAG TPA: phenylalanine--tRNA ligase subunit alpha [Nitrospiria bacterium]|nr:phenylalanine--tRNA ligase subunit alpha [Nitrospiria bacterium]